VIVLETVNAPVAPVAPAGFAGCGCRAVRSERRQDSSSLPLLFGVKPKVWMVGA
jgi:hypothetical protein